jgi:hypothetical protein
MTSKATGQQSKGGLRVAPFVLLSLTALTPATSPIEALGKGLRVFRLGKAEHNKGLSDWTAMAERTHESPLS